MNRTELGDELLRPDGCAGAGRLQGGVLVPILLLHGNRCQT